MRPTEGRKLRELYDGRPGMPPHEMKAVDVRLGFCVTVPAL
jgi:hypothetical protein